MISPILILFISLVGMNANSQPYQSGVDLCKRIATEEKGHWLSVPISYENKRTGETPLYYYFVKKRFSVKKPTVIFVEGGPGGTSHNYGKSFEHLATNFNILLFDQRGYVCSRPETQTLAEEQKFYGIEKSARDMERLLSHLGIDKVTVYAHSFGATIALEFAHIFPYRIKSLVLISPAFTTAEDARLTSENLMKLKSTFKPMLKESLRTKLNSIENFDYFLKASGSIAGIAGLQKFASFLNDRMTQPERIQHEEVENFFERIQKEQFGPNQRADPPLLPETKGFDLEPLGSTELITNELCFTEKSTNCFDASKYKIEVPTFIFHGAFDGTPLAEIKKLAKAMSHAQMIEFPLNGHGIEYELAAYSTRKQFEQYLTLLRLIFLGNKIEEQLAVFNSSGIYRAYLSSQ